MGQTLKMLLSPFEVTTLLSILRAMHTDLSQEELDFVFDMEDQLQLFMNELAAKEATIGNT